jgi:ubiquinone/menaquinone biosynthesis C-methylase UbiE
VPWNSGTAEAYVEYNLTDHSDVWAKIAAACAPFTNGKDVADLGCADGKLSTLLEASTCVNVDPYPPQNPLCEIIAMDGIEYLKTCPTDSLDVVISAFAVHFMDRSLLDTELKRVLRVGGRSMFFGVSSKSTLFQDQAFNELFFSVGFEKSGADGGHTPAKILEVDRPITYDEFYHFVVNRTWSNLVAMTQQDIDSLAAKIPKELQKVTLALEVYVNDF